jgi:cytoskeleton protein RodZ
VTTGAAAGAAPCNGAGDNCGVIPASAGAVAAGCDAASDWFSGGVTSVSVTLPSCCPSATAPALAGMTPQLSPAPLQGAAPAAAPVVTGTPQAANSLVLNLRQDSWVDVKRADNTTLTSRVMRAGSSETFELTGPLTVTVGNARGVDATVRGTPLDLAATTRNNVARVSIK